MSRLRWKPAQGRETWRIFGADGRLEIEGVTSDHDASWIFRQVGGHHCGRCRTDVNAGDRCFCADSLRSRTL